MCFRSAFSTGLFLLLPLLPLSGQEIVVQDGSVQYIDSPLSVEQILVQRGGDLTINAPVRIEDPLSTGKLLNGSADAGELRLIRDTARNLGTEGPFFTSTPPYYPYFPYTDPPLVLLEESGSNFVDVGGANSVISGSFSGVISNSIGLAAPLNSRAGHVVINARMETESLFVSQTALLKVNDTLSADLAGLIESSKSVVDGQLKFDYLLADGDARLEVHGRLRGRSLNLSGNSSSVILGKAQVNQATTYEGARLNVAGTLQVENSLILNGGHLRGSGTIIGNVNNISATVLPGQRIGTLRIRGDYRQQSGPFEAIPSRTRINSLSGYDVGNSGFLTAPPLHFGIGSLHFHVGDIGRTISVYPFEPSVSNSPSYSGGRLGIRIRGSNYDRLRIDGKARLGGYINVDTGGDVPSVDDRFRILTATGGIQGRIGVTSPIYGNRQSSYLYPMQTTRSGNSLFLETDKRALLNSTLDYTVLSQVLNTLTVSNMQLSQLENHLIAAAEENAADTPVHAGPTEVATVEENRWSGFVEGTGVMTRSELIPGGVNAGTGIVGANYRLNEKLSTGFYAGYGQIGDDNTAVRIVSGRFGLLQNWNPLDSLYLYGTVGGALHGYHMSRQTAVGAAVSDTTGVEFNTLWGGGYDLHLGGLSSGPFASIQYSWISLEDEDETGAGAFNARYTDQSDDTLLTTVGWKTSYTFSITPAIQATPRIRAAWQHSYIADGTSVKVGLANASSPTTSVSALPTGDNDFFFGSAGLDLHFGERLGAAVAYTISTPFDQTYVHGVQAALHYDF